MKFPKLITKKSFMAPALVLLAGLFLVVASASAQKIDAPTANPSGDLDQCRNGVDGLTPCTGAAWENGNVGQSNSLYSEDQYLPYRMRFSNLTVGSTYLVVLGYDSLQSDKHAIDYLGSYDTLQIVPRLTNNPVVRAGVDPCNGVSGCSLSVFDTISIPQDTVNVTGQTDPLTNQPVYEPSNQVMTMFGGDLLSFTYGSLVPNGNGNATQRVGIVFTANVTNPVLAWSGHVAYAGDWGIGNSAGALQGSPYHMRFVGLCVGADGTAVCTQGGNQDRSLAASAVIVAGVLNVVKVVNTFDNSGVAITSFPFTASTNFGTGNFSLVDNVPGAGGASIVSAGISSFGAANNITVNEENTAGWTLSDLTCTNNGLASATTSIAVQPAAHAGTAVVTMSEGGIATCTFTNSEVRTTAAPVSITGQVRTSDGSPLSGITIRLTDVTTGEIRTAQTNTFGFYTFDNLTSQDFFQLTVTSKRYRFQNNTRSFSLNDDVAGVDFICSSL